MTGKPTNFEPTRSRIAIRRCLSLRDLRSLLCQAAYRREAGSRLKSTRNPLSCNNNPTHSNPFHRVYTPGFAFRPAFCFKIPVVPGRAKSYGGCAFPRSTFRAPNSTFHNAPEPRRSTPGPLPSSHMQLKSFILALLLCGIVGNAAAAEQNSWFLLTSHVNEKDGLHLAVSPDGLNWQVVNADKPMFKHAVGEVFRDPSIARDNAGTFHLVWTSSWNTRNGKAIGYASSTNLVDWGDQRLIPVMENEPNAEFVWAPELFWDAREKQWIIHWSSSVTGKFPETLGVGVGKANPRIYYTTTKDFQNLAPSKLLFNADCVAIDSYLYRGNDDQFYVFFKADRRETPKRGIMLAKAPAATGPFVLDTKMITPEDEGWAEGPCAVTVDGKCRLYYTIGSNVNDFRAFESTDMKTWTDIRKEMDPPKGYRHGTVIRISESEAKRLLNQ